MFVTTKMSYMAVMSLKDDSDRVAKCLLNLGVINFSTVSTLEGVDISLLEPAIKESSKEQITDLRRRVDSFLEIGNFPTPRVSHIDMSKVEGVNIVTCAKFLDYLAADLDDIRKEQKLLNEKIEHLKKLERSFKAGLTVNTDQLPTSQTRYLELRVGRIHASFINDFKQSFVGRSIALEVINEGKTCLIKLAFLKSDSTQIEAILNRYHWQEVGPDEVQAFADEESLKQVKAKLYEAVNELEKLQHDGHAVVASKRSELEQMWLKLRINELYVRAESSFSSTASTILFSGWLPSSQVKKTISALKEATNNRLIYEIYKASQVMQQDGRHMEAPSQMKNPKFLSPFEMLVKSYSVPLYNTVDPTIFVSILFIIMFGMMFADAGQGLVLTIIGSLICIKNSTRDAKMFKLGWLIIYCSIASIIGGILFGSYFGYPIFKPLWFDYHGIVTHGHPYVATKSPIVAITDIMALTIKFGLSVIGLSFLLNFINRIKRHEWIDLILSRNGVAGATMFAALVYSAWGYVESGYKVFSATNIVVPLVVGLSLALFFEEPLKYIFIHKKELKTTFRPSIFGEWVVNWLIELMEFFINSMSNTLSFVRVAALGIAHVALMSALYAIADQIDIPLIALLVRILANILVIALEGFGAGINSVRLNYYEFFGRYFLGGGNNYSPLSVQSQKD